MSEATFVNLGFESAGVTLGSAQSWQLHFQSSAEDIAAFGPEPVSPVERFEVGWLFNENYTSSFGPTSIEPTLYDSAPTSVEDFEGEWFSNETFLFEHSGLASAFFDIENASKPAEDFDELWHDNDVFLYSFSTGSLSAPFTDALEASWRSNQSFLYAFSSGNVSAATFDGAGTAEPIEDFDELWPSIRMVTL
jgi:hypothetical protein